MKSRLTMRVVLSVIYMLHVIAQETSLPSFGDVAASAGPVIFTCFCSAGKRQNGSDCITGKTMISVYDSVLDDAYDVDLSRWRTEIRPPICSSPNQATVELEGDYFFLLPNGSVLVTDINVVIDTYCIQHYTNAVVYPNVKVCLQLPLLNVCCQEGNVLEMSGTCVETDRTASVAFGWDNFPKLLHRFEYCPPGYFQYIQEIQEYNPGAYKLYDSLKLLLGLQPRLPNMYCVGLQRIHVGYRYVAKSCIPEKKNGLCCPPDLIQDVNGSCVVPDTSLAKALWPEDKEFFYNPLECPQGQKPTSILLWEEDVISQKNFRNDITYDFESLTSGNYCLGVSFQGGTVTYRGFSCSPDSDLVYDTYCKNNSNVTCIFKCCEEDSVLLTNGLTCVKSMQPFSILNSNDVIKIDADVNDRIIINGKPSCQEVFLHDIKEYPSAFIDSYGKLNIGHNKLHPTSYCIDTFINEKNKIHVGILSCPQGEEDPCMWRYTLMNTLLGVSCVFFLATLAVYVTVRELRNKMVGKCLICEVLSLKVSYIILIILQTKTDFSETGCRAAGVIELFSVLASFFWLNALCYDMWSNLRHLRPIEDSHAEGQKKRFLRYSVYCWGIPFIVGAVGLVLEALPKENHVIRLNFQGNQCFFNKRDKLSSFVYMYGIILILLLANLWFFGHVAFILLKGKREQLRLTKHPDSKMSATNLSSNIDNFKLYGKLFIVMGISWLVEVITYFVSYEGTCYDWIFDLMNLLRGVLIFVIFVCKKMTLDKVKVAWGISPQSNHSKTSMTSVASRKTSTTSSGSLFSTKRETEQQVQGSLPQSIHMSTIAE